MASPPLTSREYAYFHVGGPGTHEQVTEILGIKPSEAWNVGDINSRNGKPWKSMSWRLSSHLEDTEPLEMHIKRLFFHLRPKADALRRLWVDYNLTLQCVGHFPSSGHGVHFDREQIRQAANLGLAFDLDFYYVDDDGRDL